jgi:hypothetical protein
MTLRHQLSEVSIIWERRADSEFAPGFRSNQTASNAPEFSFVLFWTSAATKGTPTPHLTFELRRNDEPLDRSVPPNGQYIGLAADLAVLYILLFRPSRLVRCGFDPLAAARALKLRRIHRFSLSPQASEAIRPPHNTSPNESLLTLPPVSTVPTRAPPCSRSFRRAARPAPPAPSATLWVSMK